MILSDFVEATSRLEAYYEKEYTDEQRKIMFDELEKLSIEKYRRIIAQCIKSCKFLPKLADMLKVSSEINYASFEKNREYTPCKVCGGKGLVKYSKIFQEIGYEYDYVCRCNCKNAEYYSKKIPTFEELGIQPEDRVVINFE